MKIAIASLQCESNTICPIPTLEADFDRAYGADMLAKTHVADMVEAAGYEVLPTLYAHALPGGPVRKEDYLRLAHGIVDRIEPGVAGVWLYLHGAMYVEDIGSGEAYLLQLIRDKLGDTVPISVGMDFHANNDDRVFALANAICGFRTAPHIDRIETERKTMRMLLTMLETGALPKPRYARAPVVIPGDAVQTALPPLNAIMAMADDMEKEDGVLCAQVFNGQPWVDAPYMGPNMVVTHATDPARAQAMADKLARAFYDARYDFKFLIEAVEPDEAIRLAMADGGQVFVSDSGDNTTAGASGDNALMLNRMRALGVKDALLAGITDAAAVDRCYAAHIGDTLTLAIGGSIDPRSEKATITGKLIHRGEILGYTGELAGETATIDTGDITVIIAKRRTAVTSLEAFQSIDLDIAPYRLIVVKLGYLFPGLQAIARRAILAFTPGSSAERLQDMGHTHITRPIYPLDDNFWDDKNTAK